jgi:hypothetical protein
MALTRLGLNQSINLASNTTGTLAVGNGGTGLTSGTTDQFLKFTGSTTLAPAEAGGGKVLQVVTQPKNSDSFTTGGFSTLFTCAITPSATSSKILVLASIQYNNYGNGSTNYPHGTVQLLNHADTTLCKAYALFGGNLGGDSTDQFDSSISLTALDSPNSTSARTYKVSYKAGAGRFGIMGAGERENGSSLTLIEIGA